MAVRTVFFSDGEKVRSKKVSFPWHSGFCKKQVQKNIVEIQVALDLPCLEVSSKSDQYIGTKLSAFSLMLNGRSMESQYHAAKVFENGGPYKEIATLSPRAAKSDERLWQSGSLVGFCFDDGTVWGTDTRTAFYDYMYYNAVRQTIDCDELLEIMDFVYYSDFYYNAQRMRASQARSIALVKLIYQSFGELPKMSAENFLAFHLAKVIC